MKYNRKQRLEETNTQKKEIKRQKTTRCECQNIGNNHKNSLEENVKKKRGGEDSDNKSICKSEREYERENIGRSKRSKTGETVNIERKVRASLQDEQPS